MVKKEITINNISGWEAKLAAMFIQKASNYKSTVWIEKRRKESQCKKSFGSFVAGNRKRQ